MPEKRIPELNRLWEIHQAALVITVTLRLTPEKAIRSAWPAALTLQSYARSGILHFAQELGVSVPHQDALVRLAVEADEAAQADCWAALETAAGEVQRYAMDAINQISQEAP
jgi:hypothetical protein